MEHTNAVADYYDRNTRWFQRVARGSDAGGIHRELWGEGVSNATEAVLHANALVAERLPAELPEPRMVDLGCGVGGSLCWILARHPGTGVGLTISRQQVALATERAASASLRDRCTFVHGDFTDPPDIGTFDLAFAIEAFIHSPEPAAFLSAAARLLHPGGQLVIIDDFLAEDPPAPASERALARFVAGWHAASVSTVERLVPLARASGLELVDDRDLTPLVAVGRPRDLWVAFWVRALGWAPIHHPYWSSLLGGDALQTCLRRGWITYRRLVFRKT